jgi:hypothetical protein
MFLDIIHRPVFIWNHNVSETGFYLRLQVKTTQLSPIPGLLKRPLQGRDQNRSANDDDDDDDDDVVYGSFYEANNS